MEWLLESSEESSGHPASIVRRVRAAVPAASSGIQLGEGWGSGVGVSVEEGRRREVSVHVCEW